MFVALSRSLGVVLVCLNKVWSVVVVMILVVKVFAGSSGCSACGVKIALGDRGNCAARFGSIAVVASSGISIGVVDEL